jgi:hypothetical protein
MDQLVDDIAAKTGLDAAAARRAVGIIINWLGHEGPQEKVNSLIDALPGARALANENGGASGGLLGVFNDLTAAGLGMSDIQAVTREFMDYARGKVGDAEVNAVVKAIPGLSQFV